jgi:hypothetical protein
MKPEEIDDMLNKPLPYIIVNDVETWNKLHPYNKIKDEYTKQAFLNATIYSKPEPLPTKLQRIIGKIDMAWFNFKYSMSDLGQFIIDTLPIWFMLIALIIFIITMVYNA